MDKVVEQSQTEPAATGLRLGYHGAENAPQQGLPIVCESCGGTYHVKSPRASANSRRLCSRCRSQSGIAKAREVAPSTTPESSKAERVRANGLLNKRIKSGKVDRPGACQHCGKEGKVDGHHPDYQQPDLCVFLCRSCHMKAHRDKDFEKQVARKASSSGAVDQKHSWRKADVGAIGGVA